MRARVGLPGSLAALLMTAVLGVWAAPAAASESPEALFAKAAALEGQKDYDQALAVLDEIARRFGQDQAPAMREAVAKALFSRGLVLGKRGEFAKKIENCDAVLTRYGQDPDPNLRRWAARAGNSKGFTLLCSAKAQWGAPQQRQALLDQALSLFLGALADIAPEHRPMVLGNQGYALLLLGREDQAPAPLREALRLGGQKAYDTELADAAVNPVPDKDDAFRSLLGKLWAEVKPEVKPAAEDKK